MKKTICSKWVWVIALMLGGITSCASTNNAHHSHEQHNQHSSKDSSQYSLIDNAITQTSEQGKYIISLHCNNSPIPLRKIHSWTVHIETPDGKPVENAKVFVFGGMPMHNHEFPTIPRIKTNLGNGDYLVEGIKFSMIGHWEMHFNIEQENKRDRVIFKIHM